MVRKGKLPPGIAALHGGGFAGKTLVLVNNSQGHKTGRNSAAQQKTSPLIYAIIGVALLLITVGIIFAFAAGSAPEMRSPTDIPKRYAEKINDLLKYTRDLKATQPEKAHAAIQKFLSSEPSPGTLEDYNKRYELISAFGQLDEAMIKAQSDVRRKLSAQHISERERTRNLNE